MIDRYIDDPLPERLVDSYARASDEIRESTKLILFEKINGNQSLDFYRGMMRGLVEVQVLAMDYPDCQKLEITSDSIARYIASGMRDRTLGFIKGSDDTVYDSTVKDKDLEKAVNDFDDFGSEAISKAEGRFSGKQTLDFYEGLLRSFQLMKVYFESDRLEREEVGMYLSFHFSFLATKIKEKRGVKEEDSQESLSSLLQ
jgi:hypothetical protein